MNDSPHAETSHATKIRKPTDLYYMPGRWYSFTICPRDQLETNVNRWKRMCDRIYECVLSTLSTVSHYRYNVEISEPHDTIKESTICRIHAHGRFSLFDSNAVLQFLLFGLRNLSQLGILEIDTIEDMEVWDKYCEKQIAITRFETVLKMDTPRPKKRVYLEPYDKPKACRVDFWVPPKPQYALKVASDSDD